MSDKPSIAELRRLQAAQSHPDMRWFHRSRFLSLVPDNRGVGATLPTNHIGVLSDREDAEMVVALRSAAPMLLEIAAAALALRDCYGSPEREIDALTALFRALNKVSP